MDEAAIDHARYGWGSEEWVHDSQIVVEETTRRGMSVSFTSGTNWSNANLPTIDAGPPGGGEGARRRRRGPARGRRRSGPLPRIDLARGTARRGTLPGHRDQAPEQQHSSRSSPHRC